MEISDSRSPDQGVVREVRFAVVMYGGVSLAIYINGIAQELLKMCRATIRNQKSGRAETTARLWTAFSVGTISCGDDSTGPCGS